MQSALLPEWILCGLLVNLACGRCGARGPTWRVSRPSITLGPDTAALELTVRCMCGARSAKRMELPVLQLGFMLVHGTAVELCLAGARSNQPEMRVTPRPSDELMRVCRAYHGVVNRLLERALTEGLDAGPDKKSWKDPTAGSGNAGGLCDECAASDVWDMTPGEWAQFLHRLGFGAPEDAEQHGPKESDASRDKTPPPDAGDLPDLPNDAAGPPGPDDKEL
jgi:hypothetical protein